MPPRIPIRPSRPRLPSTNPPTCLIFASHHLPSTSISSIIPTSLPSPSSQLFLQCRTIRSILKPAPKTSPYNDGLQPSAHDKLAILARRAATTPHRTGLLARKAGMSAVFDPVTGERLPVTVLVVDRTQVLGHKTLDVHGYWAVIIGFGHKPESRLTRAELGVFKSAGVAGKEKAGEFQVLGEQGLVPVGTELRADWFKVGQWVDVQGTTKGKGFQGGMKRHGWKGQPASHGQSLTHRTMGSAGGGQGSGSRVHPGKTMAGRMSPHLHTVQNLKVVKVDAENGLILVKGPISGPKHSIVKIQDAKKKPKMAGELDLPTTTSYLQSMKESDATIEASKEVAQS